MHAFEGRTDGRTDGHTDGRPARANTRLIAAARKNNDKLVNFDYKSIKKTVFRSPLNSSRSMTQLLGVFHPVF